MPGSPSSATRSAASGRRTTTWARRGRGAARRRPRRQGAGHRHRRHPARGRGAIQAARWPAPSPGIRTGRAAWASPSATTPRPASSTPPRSRRTIASSTAPASSSRTPSVTAYKSKPPKLDWNDIWGRVTGRSSTARVELTSGRTSAGCRHPADIFPRILAGAPHATAAATPGGHGQATGGAGRRSPCWPALRRHRPHQPELPHLRQFRPHRTRRRFRWCSASAPPSSS